MRSPNRRNAEILVRILVWILIWSIVVLLPCAAASGADETAGATAHDSIDASPEPPAPSDAPQIALDQLLRLPNSFEADVDRRGGATASQWRSRFAAAREQIEEAKLQLARTEQELGQASDSSTAWQVSAPGANDPQTSPLSLRLRHEIKDHRAQIEEAGRRLRALNVEADLAAVPEGWRQ